MKTWTQSPWILPALSGVLLALAYLPFGLLIPNLVALVPFLSWLDANPGACWQRRARAGLVFGLTVNVIMLHWVFAMVRISWLAIALFVLLVSVFSINVALSMTLVGWIRRCTGWSYLWVLPACWISLEWARTWTDLRMTADHLAHALAGYPFLVQFADVVGPYGVGAFVLGCNALVHEAIRGRRRPVWVLGGLLAAVLAYDAWAWTHPPEPVGTARVGIVQPNIPLEIKHDETTTRTQWEILADLTRRAAEDGAEVVVWPESAFPRPLYHWLGVPATFGLPRLERLAEETGVWILTGAEYVRVRDREDYDYHNAALVAGPDGELRSEWAAKVFLVPFTEKIPFEPVLAPLFHDASGELRWMAGGFAPGPAGRPLRVAGARVGVLVCYEELYFDLSRRLRNAGAEVQVVITNDAWFGRTVFQAYQANTVSLRAIENRSAFLRVANTGISGFVDPLGRYHKRTGLFVPAVEVFDVPLTATRTVYARTGNVVAWICLAGFAVMIVVAAGRGRPRPRERKEADEPPHQRDDVGGVPRAGSVPHEPGPDSGGNDRGPWRDPPRNGHPHSGGDGA